MFPDKNKKKIMKFAWCWLNASEIINIQINKGTFRRPPPPPPTADLII